MAFRLVIFHALQKRFLYWVKPPETSIVLGTLTDLLRGKSELIAENALLRQQLIILRRQVKRPVYKKTDRLLLVQLARMVRTWKQALFLVQPETLLGWHRELFRLFCKHRSKARSSNPHSEVYEARSHHTAERTELENVPMQSCCRDMGL